MPTNTLIADVCQYLPAILMAFVFVWGKWAAPTTAAWPAFSRISSLALVAAGVGLVAALWAGAGAPRTHAFGLAATLLGAWLAVLVQFLGTVIGAFSARYLYGEAGQVRYVTALAGVIGCVHVLLLANHWVVLILAWSGVGVCLQSLLCFYSERPFARLAAYKKRLADLAADGLLITAAVSAWSVVGSGSLDDLKHHLALGLSSPQMSLSAVCLVLAVILRTALLPVHGWLIQVMEAPTPVSALLHAGVVNLGGFVLIRLADLTEAAPAARLLLVIMGSATAVLAGLVMLTRVSVKVRLAWSTVAQMGFMLMECGLGLYTLALLHLIGHSLYKAHQFLAASSAVRQTKLQALRGPLTPATTSLMLAPWCSLGLVVGVDRLIAVVFEGSWAQTPWPWWWQMILALAWAPLLWSGSLPTGMGVLRIRQSALRVVSVVALTLLAKLSHSVPFGVQDAVEASAARGLLGLVSMVTVYSVLVLLLLRPGKITTLRRWSYAGFYVDEAFTRIALRFVNAGWNNSSMTVKR
jgi:NAD(P)H-quinone oxidoreductase subunit 5